MRLFQTIGRYFMWRSIDIALRKNAPAQFVTSGATGRKNNFYEVYLLDRTGVLLFVAKEMNERGLVGKWSEDGKNFIPDLPCSVPYRFLSEYRLYVQHHYRGWVFTSPGVASFVWKYLVGYPFWRVMVDRILQLLFNRRKLTRRDRMKVLKHILAETIKDRRYQVSDTKLLTHFYSARWVHRSDRDALMTYYTLLLESLAESKDLELATYGYVLKPKALNTITDFEQEERRHSENAKTQRGIYWLTGALLLIGGIQAASAAYEAWLK